MEPVLTNEQYRAQLRTLCKQHNIPVKIAQGKVILTLDNGSTAEYTNDVYGLIDAINDVKSGAL